MKQPFIMGGCRAALVSLLILSVSAEVSAQGAVQRFDFDRGMTIGGRGADRPANNGGANSFKGEGNSRRNDKPNDPPAATPPPPPKQQVSPPVDFSKAAQTVISPTSKKAIQNIRRMLYAKTTIKYTLLGGYLLDFFTSDKWENMYNLVKVYNDNDLIKIANVFSPLDNFAKTSIRNEIESTIVELDRERSELNGKKQNSDQISREIKFWSGIITLVTREISATSVTTKSTPRVNQKTAVPMYKLYMNKIDVEVVQERVNRKKSRFTNRLVASNTILSQINRVDYFYNDESFIAP